MRWSTFGLVLASGAVMLLLARRGVARSKRIGVHTKIDMIPSSGDASAEPRSWVRGRARDVRSPVLGLTRLGRRLLPEAVAALAVWMTAGRCGLAPPLDALDLGGIMIVGGWVLRAGLYLATLAHGAGHALTVTALMPRAGHGTFREQMAGYLKRLPFRSLWPGQKIFIPGLSRESEAPFLKAPQDGWRTRLAGLAGPVANTVAALGFFLALPTEWSLNPADGVLGTFAAAQGLAALTSWSDFEALFTGRALRLYCGNLVVLGKVNALSTERSHAGRERRMWWQIVVRGSQSGGRFLLTTKGFVGWKGVNPKRAKLPRTVDRGFRLAKAWGRIRGARIVEGLYQTQSHVRFATGGASTRNTTQPMSWRGPHKAAVWEIDGGKITQKRRIQHHLFSFNGDIDGWVRRTGDPALRHRLFDTALSGQALQRVLTKILGDPPAGSGRDGLVLTDTIVGAGFQDLFLTQGRWGDSFRMAYALEVAAKPEDLDVLRPETVRQFNTAAGAVWRRWLSENSIVGVNCKTLAELYDKEWARLPALIQAIEIQSLSIRGLKGLLNQEMRADLIRACVRGFFLNDLCEASRAFAEHAEGTFATVMQSSLYPGEVSLTSFKQPLYIGVHAAADPEQDYLVVASEAASVLVAGDPEPEGRPKRPNHLYLMRDGELAHLRLHLGSARSTIAFRDGFGAGAREMVQTLNPADLERRARLSEAEGGRGWVSLGDDNAYFSELRPTAEEAADPVRDSLDQVAAVFDGIQKDWADPASFNRRTAEVFGEFLQAQVHRAEAASKEGRGPAKNARLDLLVLGAGESLALGAAFVEDLQRLFPKLHLQAVDSKAFATDPEGLPIGQDTLVLGVSHSGQYFNTLDDVKFLQAAHSLGRVGPVFVFAGQWATLMGQAVGQSFKSQAPFCDRIFTDGSGWRLEEPHGLTTAAAHCTFNHLLLQLAERAAAEQPSSGDGSCGLGVSDDDIRFLRSRLMEVPRHAEEIIGRNVKGFTLASPVHAALRREGRWLSWFLVEPLAVAVLSALHLAAVFAWGTNPVAAAVTALSTSLHNAPDPTFWSVASLYGQVVYFFLMAPVVIALLLRAAMRRPLTDRFTGRNLYIAERRRVATLVESFVRRLFALGYGFSGFQDPKSGDPAASFVDEVAPSISRGDVLVKGVPAEPRLRATAGMVSTQLRGAPSLNQSAYALGIGHEKSARGNFDRFVSVGGTVDSAATLGETARRLDESRILSLYRLLGHYVVFHALASRVRRTVNATLPIINAAGAPVFFLVYILTLGRWAVWFRPWDISETQSRANIFTTSVAPPIGIQPEEYRPLLWGGTAKSNPRPHLCTIEPGPGGVSFSRRNAGELMRG